MMNYSSHWDHFQTGTQWPEWRGVHTGTYTYVRWLDGREEVYDNREDPFQMRNLVENGRAAAVLSDLRERLQGLLKTAHDEFAPGTAYADWYHEERNLVRTARGPITAARTGV